MNRQVVRRHKRGTPKPQSSFTYDTTPQSCQWCGERDVPPCPRCGHAVCLSCVALARDCPLCLAAYACCSSCTESLATQEAG